VSADWRNKKAAREGGFYGTTWRTLEAGA